MGPALQGTVGKVKVEGALREAQYFQIFIMEKETFFFFLNVKRLYCLKHKKSKNWYGISFLSLLSEVIKIQCHLVLYTLETLEVHTLYKKALKTYNEMIKNKTTS